MASIFDNPSAFAAMYDDTIVIRGTRADGSHIETTVSACIFGAGDGDPLSDEALETERDDISINVQDNDWHYFVGMRRGDKLTWKNREFAFLSAKYDQVMGWIIKARSTGGAS